MNKKYILYTLFFILVLTVLYFLIYEINKPKSDQINNAKSNLDSRDKLPKFENPLTGEIVYSDSEPLFTKNTPLAIVVNNALPARPQAGLANADIIYEIVAEGGITRFLAFYLSELPQKVGPIRSVREYFLIPVKELGDSILMHIGYSPQALQKISEWDVKSIGLRGASFYRDNRGNLKVATEHTAFANAEELFSFATSVNLNNQTNFTSWKFNDSLDPDSSLKANFLKIDFWYEGDYSAFFKYDINSKDYVRYSGIYNNEPQILIDDLTKKDVRVKNVIVQFADEVPIPGDTQGRLDYVLIGEGKGLVFRDGIVIPSKWKKDTLNSRTLFFTYEGKEIEFARGKFWISVVPSRNENQVKYSE
jgi:hypothetical protein